MHYDTISECDLSANYTLYRLIIVMIGIADNSYVLDEIYGFVINIGGFVFGAERFVLCP